MKKILLVIVFSTIVNLIASAQGFQPVEITAGDNHSVVRCITNTAESFGDNSSGELGDGTFTDNSTPVQVALTDIYTVTAKGFQTIFLKTDGTVRASGWNNFGQLGDGTNTDRSTPAQVTSLSNIIGIGAGVYHTLFIHEDSTVSTTGNNLTGQLGDGTTNNRNLPDTINGLDSVVAVTGGTYHSLFLKDNGKVWAVGGNFSGQLGDGTTNETHALIQIPSLNNVIEIASGESHSLFLKSNGTVWACGNNSYGQLGDGTTDNQLTPVQVSGLTDIIAVSAAYSHSLFLKDDGTVYACGLNNYGQLGNNLQTSTGANPPSQVSNLTGVIAIAAGASQSLFLKGDGTVWACGSNSNGQLGDGGVTFGNSLVPIETIEMCNVTALNETEMKVFIYPNPSNGNFTVNVNGNDAVNSQITIYNSIGQIVYSEQINSARTQIDLSKHTSGIYFCRVESKTKSILSEKVFLR